MVNTMDPTDMRLIVMQNCDKQLASRGWAINSENRYWLYTGMLEAWTKSDGNNPEAKPWIAALQKEIDCVRKDLTPDQLDPNK